MSLFQQARQAIAALELAIESAKAENAQLEKLVETAELAAVRASGYHHVCNAQASHNFGYYQHLHKVELDKYWAQDENIIYAHSNTAYFGREATYNYYINTPKSMMERQRKAAADNFGMTHFKEGDGPGYRVHNVIGSPIVEIAADGNSAQGIWMAYTMMSQLEPNGTANPSYGLARYGDEFLRESDKGDGLVWKMWHRRDYVDNMLPCNPVDQLPFENNVPDIPEEQWEQNGIYRIEMLSDIIYTPVSLTYREPAIPQPYETWDDSMSYIKPINGKEPSDERSKTQ